MSRLGIVTYGHSTLRKKAVKVTNFDKNLRILVQDMVETMRDSNGIGLAAPQINKSIQLLVVDMSLIDENEDYKAFINPEITFFSEEEESMEEGCLSIPGINEVVTRPETIQLNYQDEDGNSQELEASGLLAVVLQHEIDHLNGIMFTDHLSPIRKRLLGNKLNALESVGMV